MTRTSGLTSTAVGRSQPIPPTARYVCFFANNNTPFYGTAFALGSFVNNSYQRLKGDIQTTNYGLDAITKLRPVTYRWNDSAVNKSMPPADKARMRLGFIAQEVQKVVPELVSTDPRGYFAIDYPSFAAPIVKAVQELKTLFDGDHGELMKLKAANDNHALKALEGEFRAYKAAHP